MNLSAPFIFRPVMTTLLMIALLVAGLLSYRQLPVSSMPNVNYPTINVKVSFPGSLPETMANSIALPLEKQFMAIPGLRLVSSNNTLGASSIVLQFEIEKDMQTAAQDVQAAITSAIPYLPPNLPFGPTYRKANPAEQPILYLSLTSKTLRRADLYTYANTVIGQRISMLPGVSQVTTFGSPLAVRIQVDPAKLQFHDISLAETARAISLENAFLSTGQLDGPVEAPLISVDGQLEHGPLYEPVVLAYRNGTPVRVRDVGQAVESFTNNKQLSRYGDAKEVHEAVTLAIQKEPGGNTVAIAEGIYQLLGSLQGELPPAVDIHTVFDRSIPIRLAIDDAMVTLFMALCLVVGVIFLFLGKIADTVIPSLILPMSVISTFIVMRLLNFSLDNLSVLALTLAVGFIIDDAVVVLENISRRIDAGDSPRQAALEGSRQIGFTIVSMSLSLIAVFIPMLFMGGLIGKIFHEFAITLTAITLISGAISLSLTPMLCSRFLPPRREGERKSWFSRFSDWVNEAMRERYRKVLVAVLHHRLAAILIGFVCLLATCGFLYYLPTDFLPDEDIGFFTIYTQTTEGGSSIRMLDFQNRLIQMLQKNPAVESFISISSYSEYRKGLNFIHLKQDRPPIQTIIQQMYRDLKLLPEIQGTIKNIPLIDIAVGTENRAAFQYALQSLDAKKLYPSAKRLIEKMSHDPLFQGVNSDLEVDTPQINVAILRDRASQLGIDATDIENAISLGYSYNFISRIQTAIDQYDVILELLPEMQKQADTFNQIWMRSSISKQLVPFGAVAQWEEGLGASSINHISQFPAVTITFNTSPGVALETALDWITKTSNEVLETEVTGRPVGAAQTFKESIASSGLLLLITIFTIYIILGILYESFIHPITILTTLPPAMLGGLSVLAVFGLPLSLYSFLGIILLIGIVKKNGIMMVDFALENIRHRNMSSARGHSRCLHGPFSSYYHDYDGGHLQRAADRTRLWSQAPAPAGHWAGSLLEGYFSPS